MMSDIPQGPRWWQATDEKWYPPEWHPDYTPPQPPTPPPHQVPQLPPQFAARTVQQPVVHQPSPQLQYQPVQPPYQQRYEPHQYIPSQQPPYPAWGPHYAAAPPPPPRRKRNWLRWTSLAIFVVAMTGFAANLANRNKEGTPAAAAAATVKNASNTAPTADTSAPEATDSANSTAPTSAAPGTTAPPTTEPVTVGSRENPVPLGQATTLTLEALGDADESQWTVTVDGPGEDITAAVLAENQFNQQPDEGHIFYGVPVTLTLTSANKEPLSIFFNLQLEYYGPSTLSIIDGLSSEDCGLAPDPIDDSKEVFVGGSITGTLCYPVSNEDVAGGVLLTTDDIEGDRIFLATR